MDDDDNISMLEYLNRYFENELETEENKENDKEQRVNEKEKRQRQPEDKEKEQRVKEEKRKEKGWFNILYLSLTLLIQKL